MDDRGCWEWADRLRPDGYGQFTVKMDGRWVQVLAHRFSYEMHIGPIPDSMHLDHLCRNRSCVNPWHLEPVPQVVNMDRGKGPTSFNMAKTNCPAGHPYSGDNLNLERGKWRRCRACRAVTRKLSKERARLRRLHGEAAAPHIGHIVKAVKPEEFAQWWRDETGTESLRASIETSNLPIPERVERVKGERETALAVATP